VHRFREAVAAGALPFAVQGPENALCLDGGRTIGWEILADAARQGIALDRVFVQVGGGAFASSVGTALMGADPVKVKQWAFGIATAVTAVAGALLIIVGPVDPQLGRVYIGRTFCVVVMAGLGSMSGTVVAGLILGVAETLVLTFFGASWAPAVAFGLLLVVLGVRPQGLFGR
jgi:hypothetical protein